MNRFFRHTLSLALAFLTLVSASGGTLMSVGSEISLFARAKASSVPLNNQELVHQYRLGLNIDLATDQDGNSGRRLFWYVGSQLKGKEISIYRKESEWQEFDYETNSNPEELVFKGLADEGEFLDTAGSSGDYRYKVVGPEGATAYTSSDSYWPQVEGVISDSEGKPLQAVRLEAKAIDPDDNQIINLGTSYTNSQGEYALSSFYHNSSNYTLEVFIVPFKQGYDFTASTKLFTGSSAEYYSYYDPTPASSLGVNEEQLITIMIDRYANYEMDNYQSVYQLNVQAERNSEELDPEDLVESEEEEEEDELITGNLQGYTAVPNSNPLASDEDGNITAGVIPQTNAPLVGSLANDRDRDGIIDSEDDEVVEIEIDPCDYDNDGIINEDDNDLDNDGILNRYDPDIDGDGYTNREEALGLGGDGDIDGDNFCLYLRQREKERIAYLNSSKLELSGLRTAPPKEEPLPDKRPTDEEIGDEDIDGDGIPNEIDSDSDGDGLMDLYIGDGGKLQDYEGAGVPEDLKGLEYDQGGYTVGMKSTPHYIKLEDLLKDQELLTEEAGDLPAGEYLSVFLNPKNHKNLSEYLNPTEGKDVYADYLPLDSRKLAEYLGLDSEIDEYYQGNGCKKAINTITSFHDSIPDTEGWQGFDGTLEGEELERGIMSGIGFTNLDLACAKYEADRLDLLDVRQSGKGRLMIPLGYKYEWGRTKPKKDDADQTRKLRLTKRPYIAIINYDIAPNLLEQKLVHKPEGGAEYGIEATLIGTQDFGDYMPVLDEEGEETGEVEFRGYNPCDDNIFALTSDLYKHHSNHELYAQCQVKDSETRRVELLFFEDNERIDLPQVDEGLDGPDQGLCRYYNQSAQTYVNYKCQRKHNLESIEYRRLKIYRIEEEERESDEADEDGKAIKEKIVKAKLGNNFLLPVEIRAAVVAENFNEETKEEKSALPEEEDPSNTETLEFNQKDIDFVLELEALNYQKEAAEEGETGEADIISLSPRPDFCADYDFYLTDRQEFNLEATQDDLLIANHSCEQLTFNQDQKNQYKLSFTRDLVETDRSLELFLVMHLKNDNSKTNHLHLYNIDKPADDIAIINTSKKAHHFQTLVTFDSESEEASNTHLRSNLCSRKYDLQVVGTPIYQKDPSVEEDEDLEGEESKSGIETDKITISRPRSADGSYYRAGFCQLLENEEDEEGVTYMFGFELPTFTIENKKLRGIENAYVKIIDKRKREDDPGREKVLDNLPPFTYLATDFDLERDALRLSEDSYQVPTYSANEGEIETNESFEVIGNIFAQLLNNQESLAQIYERTGLSYKIKDGELSEVSLELAEQVHGWLSGGLAKVEIGQYNNSLNYYNSRGRSWLDRTNFRSNRSNQKIITELTERWERLDRAQNLQRKPKGTNHYTLTSQAFNYDTWDSDLLIRAIYYNLANGIYQRSGIEETGEIKKIAYTFGTLSDKDTWVGADGFTKDLDTLGIAELKDLLIRGAAVQIYLDEQRKRSATAVAYGEENGADILIIRTYSHDNLDSLFLKLNLTTSTLTSYQSQEDTQGQVLSLPSDTHFSYLPLESDSQKIYGQTHSREDWDKLEFPQIDGSISEDGESEGGNEGGEGDGEESSKIKLMHLGLSDNNKAIDQEFLPAKPFPIARTESSLAKWIDQMNLPLAYLSLEDKQKRYELLIKIGGLIAELEEGCEECTVTIRRIEDGVIKEYWQDIEDEGKRYYWLGVKTQLMEDGIWGGIAYALKFGTKKFLRDPKIAKLAKSITKKTAYKIGKVIVTSGRLVAGVNYASKLNKACSSPEDTNGLPADYYCGRFDAWKTSYLVLGLGRFIPRPVAAEPSKYMVVKSGTKELATVLGKDADSVYEAAVGGLLDLSFGALEIAPEPFESAMTESDLSEAEKANLYRILSGMDEEGKKAVLEDEWRVSMMPRMEFVVSEEELKLLNKKWSWGWSDELFLEFIEEGNKQLFNLDLSPEVQEGLVDIFAELNYEEKIRFYATIKLASDMGNDFAKLATKNKWVINKLASNEYGFLRTGISEEIMKGKIKIFSSANNTDQQKAVELALGGSLDKIFEVGDKRFTKERIAEVKPYLFKIIFFEYSYLEDTSIEKVIDDPWLVRSIGLTGFGYDNFDQFMDMYSEVKGEDTLQDLIDSIIHSGISQKRWSYDGTIVNSRVEKLIILYNHYNKRVYRKAFLEALSENKDQLSHLFYIFVNLRDLKKSLHQKGIIIKELSDLFSETPGQKAIIRYEIVQFNKIKNEARHNLSIAVNKILDAIDYCEENNIPVENFMEVDISIQETVDDLPSDFSSQLSDIIAIFTKKNEMYRDNQKLKKEDLLRRYFSEEIEHDFDYYVDTIATYFIFEEDDFRRVASQYSGGFMRRSENFADIIVMPKNDFELSLAHEKLHAILAKVKTNRLSHQKISLDDIELIEETPLDGTTKRIHDILLPRLEEMLEYRVKDEILAFTYDQSDSKSDIAKHLKEKGKEALYDYSFKLRRKFISNLPNDPKIKKEAEIAMNKLMDRYDKIIENAIEIAYLRQSMYEIILLWITPLDEWHLYNPRFTESDFTLIE